MTAATGNRSTQTPPGGVGGAGQALHPSVPGWFRESPILGVINRSRPPDGFVGLLALARGFCRVVVLTDEIRQPVDATVVSHPDLLRGTSGPRAVWVGTLAELDHAGVSDVDLVLSGADNVIAQAAGRGLLVPAAVAALTTDVRGVAESSDDGGRAADTPVAPFVRRRLRRARNLPEQMVVEHDGNGWTYVPSGHCLTSGLAETAVALASVAIAGGAALLVALGWATPCVTDAETQVRVGAVRDVDVLVGDTDSERHELARSVVADERLAARLSWSGRRLVERRHRPDLVAATMVRRLGLGAASTGLGAPPLVAQLANFGTPAGAMISQRVEMSTSYVAGARD